MNRRKKSTDKARFAYDGLERVIHEKARLGILASLVTHPDGLAFAELKQLCSLTDGNLNRHLQVLQEAGLVEINKRSDEARPQTFCRMTSAGRRRFAEYIGVLEQVVCDAVEARDVAADASRSPRRGWSTG